MLPCFKIRLKICPPCFDLLINHHQLDIAPRSITCLTRDAASGGCAYSSLNMKQNSLRNIIGFRHYLQGNVVYAVIVMYQIMPLMMSC
jgi:hypothetical protein